jgi:outer membrane protein assembly factor BamB
MLLKLNLTKIISPLLLLSLVSCTAIEPENDFPQKQALKIKNKVVLRQSWEQYMGRNKLEDDSNVSLQTWNKELLGVDFQGKLKVLDLGRGNFTKDIAVNAKISAGPVIAGNIAVIATKDNQLQAINLRNNATVWATNLESEVFSTPLIVDNTVVVHTLSGAVVSYNLENGKQNWRYTHTLPATVMRRTSSPAVSNDFIIVGLASGKLVALHKTSGMVVWIFDLAKANSMFEDIDTKEILDVCADPMVLNGIVYAARFDGKLVAVNADTGELIWERDISSYAGFTVFKNKLLVIETKGNVYALNLKTGATIWQQNALVGRRLSQPVIYQKYLATSDRDGALYLVSAENGEVVAQHNILRQGVLSKLTVVKQKLCVFGSDGQLLALEIPAGKAV